MPPTVLILTERLDPTADLVVTALTERGVAVHRVDTADFPTRLTLTAEFGGARSADGWETTLRSASRSVDLGDVCGAYYRRPSAFAFPPMDGADRQWAELEARIGLGGLLATVPNWLNHPSRIGYAEYKPVQLATAGTAGLSVPRTLITNDPDAAQRFARQTGPVVYKPFSSTSERDGRRMFVYTSPVAAEELEDDAIRLTAHLFQEHLEKAYEVRLTVVDEQFFAAALTARSAAGQIDWRSDYDAIEYAVTSVPGSVRDGLCRMMRTLGLRFAAVDFAVTPSGEWYFLDLNPNGQWAWIEHETGLEICAAITSALAPT
ncbi:ATP-grasp ribosomal peptide maturase [Cryptosporangium aurantiacum]|uniref:ATP-grasp ribosomal peptide maturase, SAV_5884 family n=1 Tax=Cryptosporangium aurantiacum TaxID=134849 RepID=A0A1M7REE2_9ACTN|nr:ATP-grasp ribosomal peptide maturase [Cryptosporangium aurantiacum]SHN44580.1 ATP-grasp ribosomal peptide maturase, SAV_5884 family [Cryptosporangium aurantiacum]